MKSFASILGQSYGSRAGKKGCEGRVVGAGEWLFPGDWVVTLPPILEGWAVVLSLLWASFLLFS